MREVSIILLLTVLGAVFAQTAEQRGAPQPPAELLAWLRETAHPLRSAVPTEDDEDLEPLREIVGDARIVALGEATHGTSEFFTIKHRIVQFLAEEMDFTIFSIEANMPEAYRMNEYVLTGEGNPRELLEGMYFWTWNTQEVLDMILWMREFNDSGRGVMQFTGFDMQTPSVAAEEVRAFVAEHDPDYLAQLDKAYKVVSSVYEVSVEQDAPIDELEMWQDKATGVLNHLTNHQAAYSVATPSEVTWAVQNARIVVQAAQHKLYRASVRSSDYPSRDESMAANVEWILEQNPDAKVVLWAHNGHIKESTIGPMGGFLSKEFGDDYLSIGFTFYQGDYMARSQLDKPVQVNTASAAPADSIGGVFHELGLPFFALDLRGVERDGPASWRVWYRETRMMIGSVAVEDRRAFSKTLLPTNYDAIIFVDQMTPTNLLR